MMDSTKVELRAERVVIKGTVDIWLLGANNSYCTGMTMKTIPEFQIPPEAPISLMMSDAQVLMDDLYRAGIRPTEGSGSAGSLKATQDHLKDMQLIVYKKLGLSNVDK